MITDTKEKIIAYIKARKQAKVVDLFRLLGISQVAVHKQLRKLVEAGMLKKVGKPPVVFYVLSSAEQDESPTLPPKIQSCIDERYLYISPIGEMKLGLTGFSLWVKEIGQEKQLVQLAEEYVRSRKSADGFFAKDGWVDATKKLRSTFERSFIDSVLYQDFYSLPKFGKTKLGQLVLHAKQSQDRKLIRIIAVESKPLIEKIIERFSVQAVAYIPPTIPRKLQFLKEFERELGLSMPTIGLVKAYPGQVIVAQKSLSSLQERITNARETIFLKSPKNVFTRILLIDDAIGSGATMNETARKLKESNPAIKNIIGFGIVGSFKGFDVIREV